MYLYVAFQCIVEEDLEVLVEVSAMLSNLLLKQLQNTIEGYLTEQVARFLWRGGGGGRRKRRMRRERRKRRSQEEITAKSQRLYI